MRKLTIEHNHGACILENVTIENGNAKGICTGGGEESRLFTARSFRPYEYGVEKVYNLFGRKPYCVDEENDEWRVSCCFC